MNQEKIDRFSGLSALQITALAVVGSSITAIATLLALRRFGIVGPQVMAATTDTLTGSERPTPGAEPVVTHFSENAKLPGITAPANDSPPPANGHERSPEGV